MIQDVTTGVTTDDNRPDSYSSNRDNRRDNRSVTTDCDNRDNRGPLGCVVELNEGISDPSSGARLGGGINPPQITAGLGNVVDAIYVAGFWTWLWDGTWQDNAQAIGEPFPARLFSQASKGDPRVVAAMKRINQDYWAAVSTGDRHALEVVLQEEEMLNQHLLEIPA